MVYNLKIKRNVRENGRSTVQNRMEGSRNYTYSLYNIKVQTFVFYLKEIRETLRGDGRIEEQMKVRENTLILIIYCTVAAGK